MGRTYSGAYRGISCILISLTLSLSLFLSFFRTVQSGIFCLTVLLWYHNWRMPIKQSVSHFVMLIISGTYIYWQAPLFNFRITCLHFESERNYNWNWNWWQIWVVYRDIYIYRYINIENQYSIYVYNMVYSTVHTHKWRCI